MSDELDFLTDDDAAAIDRYVAKLAREEEEDIKRKHGTEIHDLLTARNPQGTDPLLEAIEEAHRAKAQEADKQ